MKKIKCTITEEIVASTQFMSDTCYAITAMMNAGLSHTLARIHYNQIYQGRSTCGNDRFSVDLQMLDEKLVNTTNLRGNKPTLPLVFEIEVE